MGFQNSGVNIEGIQNIEPPTINITTDIITQIPSKANEMTGGYLGLIISTPMFLFLFWYLSDTTQLGGFRYTSIRAAGLASCIVTILGYVALAAGFFNNYYHMVIFATITAICAMLIYFEER